MRKKDAHPVDDRLFAKFFAMKAVHLPLSALALVGCP
jgi:hypothetical protein